jgi:hypothetical protein
MQTLLAEQPLILSLLLGVLAVGLIYGWLQTGKQEVGAAGLVVAALIPVAWIIASNWVTDREQIEVLVYDTAEAVKNNDHDRALELIADPATRAQAKSELGSYVFDDARVTKIRNIELIAGTFPQEADVDLNVKVIVSQRTGGMHEVLVLRRLMLRLQKVGDSWAIVEYQHTPVMGGPDRYSTDRYGVRQRQ